MADQIEKLASAVMHLVDENASLRAQLGMHEKRAQAEGLLLEARNTNAPDSIKYRSVDDFLAKRAQLETSTPEHLEKVAAIIDMYENNEDAISLSDITDERGKGNLTGWLEENQ